jgi:hypothetical protein
MPVFCSSQPHRPFWPIYPLSPKVVALSSAQVSVFSTAAMAGLTATEAGALLDRVIPNLPSYDMKGNK